MKRIEKLLGEQKIAIELTEAAREHIVNVGYDPIYGARPLKRAIQREIENPIATKILENSFVEGDKITVNCVDNNLIFNKEQSQLLPTIETVNSH
jgi:ATP-dependent Clp protease ATP-binding subunit ClpB